MLPVGIGKRLRQLLEEPVQLVLIGFRKGPEQSRLPFQRHAQQPCGELLALGRQPRNGGTAARPRLFDRNQLAFFEQRQAAAHGGLVEVGRLGQFPDIEGLGAVEHHQDAPFRHAEIPGGAVIGRGAAVEAHADADQENRDVLLREQAAERKLIRLGRGNRFLLRRRHLANPGVVQTRITERSRAPYRTGVGRQHH